MTPAESVEYEQSTEFVNFCLRNSKSAFFRLRLECNCLCAMCCKVDFVVL